MNPRAYNRALDAWAWELSRMLPGVRQVMEELAGRYRQALGSGDVVQH